MNEEIKQKALKYLLYKMRSEKEMRFFLEEKHQASYDEIEEIIEYLYYYNYLDDEKYARAFLKDKINFSLVGKNKIKYDLKQKGISSEVINTVIEEHYYLDKEVEIAKKLLNKKRRILDDKNKKRKYLYSKGFSDSAINIVCENHI